MVWQWFPSEELYVNEIHEFNFLMGINIENKRLVFGVTLATAIFYFLLSF